MIHIITGDKGKGKTKALIDKVNNDVKVVSGTVVFLDNNNKHTDIEKIYIDNFKTVAYVGESHIVEALDEIKNISDMFNVDIVICLATDVNGVPDDFKDCVIAAL